jgi:hypothetical protein
VKLARVTLQGLGGGTEGEKQGKAMKRGERRERTFSTPAQELDAVFREVRGGLEEFLDLVGHFKACEV